METLQPSKRPISNVKTTNDDIQNIHESLLNQSKYQHIFVATTTAAHDFIVSQNH